LPDPERVNKMLDPTRSCAPALVSTILYCPNMSDLDTVKKTVDPTRSCSPELVSTILSKYARSDTVKKKFPGSHQILLLSTGFYNIVFII
jgi:hypothetical protein